MADMAEVHMLSVVREVAHTRRFGTGNYGTVQVFAFTSLCLRGDWVAAHVEAWIYFLAFVTYLDPIHNQSYLLRATSTVQL